MCHLPKDKNENLLVGIETSDDAAVYKINNELAIVQTLDFFTPIVDDPYLFGQIAAANSLSDVYAMGGDPLLAMNIVCFPDTLPSEYVEGILKGGQDKVREAGAMIVGGHTVEDLEPKYGLSVTGFIDPLNIKRNCTAKVGDVLVLTKPLGVGIFNTAIKASMISDDGYKKATETMLKLNKDAKNAMVKAQANSCTDITGFGFLGHTYEMAEGSNVTIKIDTDSVPIFKEALELASMGIVPAGAYKNYEHIKEYVGFGKEIDEAMMDCLNDPQTSGGLLISVDQKNLDILLNELKSTETFYAIVGEVIETSEKRIILE
jgi:selenide,water dikinase